ncbi:MAG: DMT family transporter [Christensenellaceae bacterium]|nr:DMT family transporter [Christensenellaceae bacterium]
MKTVSRSTGNLLLLLAATLWGGCMLIIRVALSAGIPATLVNFGRGLIYSLLCLIFYRRQVLAIDKTALWRGLLLGVANFGGFFLQSFSLNFTIPSNCSFLTSMNVLLVPFVLWVIHKKAPSKKRFLCMGIYLVGAALLTGLLQSGMQLNLGNALALLCSLCFSLQIAGMGIFSQKTDARQLVFLMACVQTLLGGLLFLLTDLPAFDPAAVNWPVGLGAVAILGVVGSFICSTLQAYGLKYTESSTGALILSMESVFTSVFSVAFGFESLTPQLLAGGIIIMCAIVISEADFKKLRKKPA